MNTKLSLIEKIGLTVIAILAIIAIIDGVIAIKTAPTVTFDSKWMESFMEENGEDVIYWEIDWVGDTVCRKYEYTTRKKEKIHIYYECENYSSGFEVMMNPETGRCTIWESGH